VGIQKPNSKEFFSNVDPLYRTYGKQDALRSQKEYFERDAAIEQSWLAYSARFKSFSTWNKFVASPFGDAEEAEGRFPFTRSATENQQLHEAWRRSRAGRAGYADPEHPFGHQGSADINTYKMFCEAGRALLRQDGYLGMLTPSGLYTDKGSTNLRKLLLDRSQWEWLFSFINWNKIFTSIYYRFKFCVLIARKGGRTSVFRSALSRYHIDEWEYAERYGLPYSCDRVERFSPRSSAILEIRSERDLAVLERMYRDSVLVGDDSPGGWGIQYAREFDMTSDSKFFPPKPDWEQRGYRADEYGIWCHSGGDLALPLYEGRMIGQFDFCKKAWISGKGRSADWQPSGDAFMAFDHKALGHQYLMSRDEFTQSEAFRGLKVGFLAIGSATNARSMVCTSLCDMPCGNSVPVLTTSQGDVGSLFLVATLNSLPYDFALRCRLGGVNLNYFVVEETPLPRIANWSAVAAESRKIAGLCWPQVLFCTRLAAAFREVPRSQVKSLEDVMGGD
jgi:hypothetical protein